MDKHSIFGKTNATKQPETPVSSNTHTPTPNKTPSLAPTQPLPPLIDYNDIQILSSEDRQKHLEDAGFPVPDNYFDYQNLQHVTPNHRATIIEIFARPASAKSTADIRYYARTDKRGKAFPQEKKYDRVNKK